jgi:hypothetical protein
MYEEEIKALLIKVNTSIAAETDLIDFAVTLAGMANSFSFWETKSRYVAANVLYSLHLLTEHKPAKTNIAKASNPGAVQSKRNDQLGESYGVMQSTNPTEYELAQTIYGRDWLLLVKSQPKTLPLFSCGLTL